MVRRIGLVLAAAVVAVTLGIPVSAAGAGMIRVKLDYGVPVEKGEVMLYAVAEPVEGGYRLEQAYGGGFIRREDACSPELAQWLSERTSFEGNSRKPDGEGNTEFTGLDEGLYLLIQSAAPEGWSCAAPFLVPLPLDGEWEVLACPKQAQLLIQSPKTSQKPEPLFAAMGLVLSGVGLYFCMEKLRRK